MSWNITGAPGTGEDLLYSQAGTPTLDLRFASSKNLNDYVSGQNLIDFTRGGNGIGSYFDAAGTLRQSVVNLLLRSEEFNDASWVRVGSNITANAVVAPDNTLSADKLIETTSTGEHYIERSITPVAGTYTHSIFVKAAEYNYFVFRPIHIGEAFASSAITFNLTTGPTTTTNNLITNATMQILPDGWRRCSVTLTLTSAATVHRLRIHLVKILGGPLTYAGDNTSGLFLWGGQIEPSSTMGEYVKTTSSLSGAPRFDHNPATGESLGLLIEEARTNLLLNSETLATQSVTVTAAAHTLSFYGTGTVTLSGTHSATVVGTGAFPTRTTLTFTPTSGSLTVTVSGTVQYAQVELGAFATSWISTAGATATRNADVATITGTNFSRWYSQSAGTILAQAISASASAVDITGTAIGLAVITNGTNAERIRFGALGTATIWIVNNATQASVTSGPLVAGASFKFVSAYAVNDFAATRNGATVQTASSGNLPTLSQMELGRSALNAGVFIGHIRRLTYFDRRLPNATLQAITA
jgi:hypothetical protein